MGEFNRPIQYKEQGVGVSVCHSGGTCTMRLSFSPIAATSRRGASI
jgi:hypothetical protein